MSIVFLEDSWDTYGIDHLWQWIHIDKFVSQRACTFAILCHILPYFAMIAASEPLLFKILSSYYCALQFFAGISFSIASPKSHPLFSWDFPFSINNPAIFSYHDVNGNLKATRPRAKGAWLHEVLNTLEGDFSHGFSGKMGHPIWGTKNWMGKRWENRTDTL